MTPGKNKKEFGNDNNLKQKIGVMKAISFVKLFCLILLCMFMGACVHNDLNNEFPAEEMPRHTCKMTFIGGVNGFDGSGSNTKAVSSTWKDGDKIYVTFYNGATIVSGEAVYSSASGWTVSYDGNLAIGSNQRCEARFFVNATFASSYLVSINPNTEIYEDVNGFYSYSNGEITVQASLVPKTGRIRFTGTAGSKIYLTGITSYSTYAPQSNQFTTSAAMIKETVNNGSTPYIYGYFTNSNRSISIIGDDFAFTRNCTDAILKTGESGYMAIPSEASHNNWKSGAYITLGNGTSEIELKMMPVAGHSAGFFLMAETETTEQLWTIVEGGSSPSKPTLPKVNVSYTNVQSFISKINNQTALNFSLPTEAQWRYAAQGGNKSQRYYIYAGSNNPGDVAWYSGNTSSRQPVRTKAPNELGLYDMSGNVAEWTSYSSYSYYYYGGSYLNDAIDIKVNSYSYVSSSSHSSSGIGFRLILTLR